jgi:hypothetical protein
MKEDNKKKPLKHVFVQKVPLSLLVDLLEKICSRLEGRGIENGVRLYYYVSEYEYRKMVFEHLHIHFLDTLQNYYSSFFHRYYERDFTYNSFKTILRQICKIHNIVYEKENVIINSETVVRYRVYISNTILEEHMKHKETEENDDNSSSSSKR